MQRITEVVAALIWRGDRFLACQRPANKAQALLWEFVGGKVEPGETPEQALVRECREELAVTVRVNARFMEVTHTYPERTIHLTLFHAEIVQGEPQMLEHHDIRWITVEEIDGYAFCPADTVFLEQLKRDGKPVLLEQIQGKNLTALQKRLFSLQDIKYQSFQQKLLPTVAPEAVIGVRTPALRKLAGELVGSKEEKEFLAALPHHYFEENNLHAFLIEKMRDYDQILDALCAFLPCVDNWATCDQMLPKTLKKHLPVLREQIKVWLTDSHPYTVRYAIGLLMRCYLDEAFTPEYLEWVANVQHEDYYVKMMIAWFFATALAKRYTETLPYLEQQRLEPWTHNKAIQKAVESCRISQEQKERLRLLRVKRA